MEYYTVVSFYSTWAVVKRSKLSLSDIYLETHSYWDHLDQARLVCADLQRYLKKNESQK